MKKLLMIFWGFRDAFFVEDESREESKKDIPHVFISYNWGHQSTIVQLANQLKVLSIDELDAFVSEVSSSILCHVQMICCHGFRRTDLKYG